MVRDQAGPPSRRWWAGGDQACAGPRPAASEEAEVQAQGPPDHTERTLRAPQRLIDELESGTEVELRIQTTFKRPQDEFPYLNVQRAPLVLGE